MGKLVKIGVICTIVLVGAGIGLAMFNGGKAQDYFTQELNQISVLKSLPFPLTLENTSYESGLFSSTAKTKISVDQQVIGILSHTISHGPVPTVTVVTTIDTESKEYQELMQDIPVNFSLDKLNIVTKVSLTDISNKLNIPPFGFNEDSSSFNTSEMSLEVTSDHKFESPKGKFILSRLDFKKRDDAMQIKDFSISFNSRSAEGVMLSRAETKLGNFKISDEGEVGFQFQNLKIEVDDDISEGTYHAESSLTAKNLIIHGKNFKSLHAKGSISRVDAIEFLKLIADYQGFINNNREHENKIEQSFLKVFSGSPEVKLETLEIVTPEGTVSATAGIGLSDSERPDRSYSIGENFKTYGNANLHIESPKKALYSVLWALISLEKAGPEKLTASKEKRINKSVDREINSILAEGFMVEEGDQYKVDFSYRPGVIVKNGTEVNFIASDSDAAAQSDLKNARTYSEAFYADNLRYPQDMAELKTFGLSLSKNVQCNFVAAQDQQSYELSTYSETGTKVFSTNSTSYEISERLK